jgi:hypothetical protein
VKTLKQAVLETRLLGGFYFKIDLNLEQDRLLVYDGMLMEIHNVPFIMKMSEMYKIPNEFLGTITEMTRFSELEKAIQ